MRFICQCEMKLRGRLACAITLHRSRPVELDGKDVGPQRQAVVGASSATRGSIPPKQLNVVVTSLCEVRCAKFAQIIALEAADHCVGKVQLNVGARPTHDEPLVEGKGGKLLALVSDETRITQALPKSIVGRKKRIGGCDIRPADYRRVLPACARICDRREGLQCDVTTFTRCGARRRVHWAGTCSCSCRLIMLLHICRR